MKLLQSDPEKYRKTLGEQEIVPGNPGTILTDTRKLLEFNAA